MKAMPGKTMRKLAHELVDTLCVIAYADSTEAYIRERQDALRDAYGYCIPENGMHAIGNIHDAYRRFMGVLEDGKLEDIGNRCEDILHDHLSEYMGL